MPFVFSNYTRPYGSNSKFPQSCKYRLWEALRASTAAPGFFEEYKLGNDIHQVLEESKTFLKLRSPGFLKQQKFHLRDKNFYSVSFCLIHAKGVVLSTVLPIPGMFVQAAQAAGSSKRWLGSQGHTSPSSELFTWTKGSCSNHLTASEAFY